MSRDDLITSAFGRFVKVGGLVGRVGVSVIGEQAVSLLRDGPTAQLKKAENAVRNAIRIADTLGEMKGAAMKVGQMLSLHEGLLPPEVSAVLSVLQKQAPSVSFDVMEGELRRELENFDELFESLEPDAFAAASIGQVHRGVLRDGREVAVKIQYPKADQMVEADLKNLKVLLGNLVGLVTDIDFDPIWEEVKERLFEELDYLKEAESIQRMAAMHADTPEIIVSWTASRPARPSRTNTPRSSRTSGELRCSSSLCVASLNTDSCTRTRTSPILHSVKTGKWLSTTTAA
jgi:predicted unusual protein kinase regulating ubiquinone biosynthesis (AarF/ABC1/UbiB family)